ncbi:hypothetical protein NQ113_24670 [Bacillus pseudomycoides]|uniref:hypothetical protein n=1 Tax=Bacillus pseudomycoides TaxID=64104 RepID=UPI00215B67C1|nr:hypothetical protein [Bacillus pseudomycoides]MCR8860368.1 hypothetical protein [Bacillus pseudomycoides]
MKKTEGFEEQREELKAYQKKREATRKEETQQKKEAINLKAQQLGLEGLYRLILKHEELIKRHDRAIELLSDDNFYDAYRILKGIDKIS